MYLLDANVVLEAELAQERAPECRRLLRRLKTGEVQAILTDFHLDTVVLTMERHGADPHRIHLFLRSLARYRGLTLAQQGLRSKTAATRHMRRHNLDYDDALALQAMREHHIEAILSYDRDFDRVKGIRRVEPGGV